MSDKQRPRPADQGRIRESIGIWLKAYSQYFRTLAWLYRDAFGVLGVSWPVLLSLAVVTSVLEMVIAYVTIKLISSGALTSLLLALILLATISTLAIGYWTRLRLVAMSLDYERSWITRLRLRNGAPTKNRASVGQSARHMSTILRNLNVATEGAVNAVPVVAALLYLSPILSAGIGFIIALTAVPMYLINRASSLHFQNMLKAQQSGRGVKGRPVTDLDYLDDLMNDGGDRKTQDEYQAMIRVGQTNHVVWSIAAALSTGMVLVALIEGQLSIEGAIIYLLAMRLLYGHMRSISGGITAKNRYYVTLRLLRELDEGDHARRSQER